VTSRKRGPDVTINRSSGKVSVPSRAQRAYELWKDGMTPKDIGNYFGVSRKTATEWVRKCHEAARDERLSNS
jgi:transposase